MKKFFIKALFFLLVGYGYTYGQPIYPGSLTITFANEKETLKIKSFQVLENGNIDCIAWGKNDIFNVSIIRPTITFGDENNRQYCILNTGCSVGNYSIEKILIVRNNKDRMAITLKNAENTGNYFLQISFIEGEFELDIDKIQQEQQYKLDTVKTNNNDFGRGMVKCHIITPLNWYEYKIPFLKR